MKKYSSPETMSLEVMAQSIICASGGGPARVGQIGTMGQDNGAWE